MSGRLRRVALFNLATLLVACGTSKSDGRRRGDDGSAGEPNAGASGSGAGEQGGGSGGTSSSSGGASSSGAPSGGAPLGGTSGSSGQSSGGSGAGAPSGSGGQSGASGAGGLGGSGGMDPCVWRGTAISEVPTCEALEAIVLGDLRVRTAPDGFVNPGQTGVVDVWATETSGYDSVEGILRFDFGGIEVGYGFPDTDGDVGLYRVGCTSAGYNVRVVFPSTLASGTVIPITASVRTPDAACANTSSLQTSVTVR